MSECLHITTPMPTKGRHATYSQELVHDPTMCRSLVGGHQYLPFTRLDLSYSFNYAFQLIMHFQPLVITSFSSTSLDMSMAPHILGCTSQLQLLLIFVVSQVSIGLDAL